MLSENGGHFVQSSMFKMCYRPTEKIKLVDIPAEKKQFTRRWECGVASFSCVSRGPY